MVRNQINVAYLDQKKRALHRGLEWHFTYESWVNWWLRHLGPDWFQLRGVRKYDFCMARKGDSGHYTEDNVERITNGENGRARKTNGKARPGSTNGNSKLTEAQVLEIWGAPGTLADIGRQYGVRYQTVQSIKAGRVWKHVLSTS